MFQLPYRAEALPVDEFHDKELLALGRQPEVERANDVRVDHHRGDLALVGFRFPRGAAAARFFSRICTFRQTTRPVVVSIALWTLDMLPCDVSARMVKRRSRLTLAIFGFEGIDRKSFLSEASMGASRHVGYPTCLAAVHFASMDSWWRRTLSTCPIL